MEPWWLLLGGSFAGLVIWHFARPRPQSPAPPEISRPSSLDALGIRGVVEIRRAEPDDIDVDDEDGYSEFVQTMWRKADIPCGEIAIEVNGAVCVLHSLTRGTENRVYANLVSGRPARKKTFACDDRHRWSVGGQRFSSAVFKAIAAGHATPEQIQADDHPATMADAMAADRLDTTARRFALQYAGSDGVVAWRVISRLNRGPEHLYAACHLRWGESRSFRNDRLLTLVDTESGETIDLPAYVARRIDLPPRKKRKPKAG